MTRPHQLMIRRLAVSAVLLLPLAGCGPADNAVPGTGSGRAGTVSVRHQGAAHRTANRRGPTNGSASNRSVESAGTVTVSGTVLHGDGTPDADTVVVFRRVGAEHGTTAITGQDGTYQVKLSPGDYSASCVSLSGSCESVGDAHLTVAASRTHDFRVMSSQRSRPPSTPASSSSTATGPVDVEQQCRNGGFDVCGQVTMNGKPMPGVIVEFRLGISVQTTTTNRYGGYGIALDLPTATEFCIEPDNLLDADYTCGAVGTDGGPVTVSNGSTGQIVNFRLCPGSEYPACLRQP